MHHLYNEHMEGQCHGCGKNKKIGMHRLCINCSFDNIGTLNLDYTEKSLASGTIVFKPKNGIKPNN